MASYKRFSFSFKIVFSFFTKGNIFRLMRTEKHSLRLKYLAKLHWY